MSQVVLLVEDNHDNRMIYASCCNRVVQTILDLELNAYVIRMPSVISLRDLKEWSEDFEDRLRERPEPRAFSMLIDTNLHHFESVECLQFLRRILTHLSRIHGGLCKVAFVQPVQYRRPEIVGPEEAYFSNPVAARAWLHGP